VDANQIVIKSILITVFAVLALVVIVPGRGARGLAIRRLAGVVFLGVGVLAIAFPHLTNGLAVFLGIGRGTDLLLYGLIIIFLGYVVAAAAHTRRTDRQITDLTRALALAQAGSPTELSATDHPDGRPIN